MKPLPAAGLRNMPWDDDGDVGGVEEGDNLIMLLIVFVCYIYL